MRSVGQKNVAAILALFLAATLTGCGGSSPTSTTGNDNNSTTSVSGVVADGYLNGATVCLDMNGNKKYDIGEPTTKTGAGGAYTLTGVTAAEVAAYPILVEVTAGTVDEERGLVTTPYVLTAPAGTNFVSPLTTLVQNQMEASGISITEAEQTVKSQLGFITMSPLQDYKPGVSSASDEAKLAANVAKVIATTIAANTVSIEKAVKDSGGTTTVQAVVNLIANQVMQNLSGIVQQVKSNATSSGALSEDKVAIICGTVAVSTDDSAQLQQQLTTAGSGASAPALLSDLPAALTAGMYWVEQWGSGTQTNVTYEEILLTPSSRAMTFRKYDLVNNAWQADTSLDADDDLYLTASGWQIDSDTGGTFDSTTGLYSSAKGFQKMIVRGVKIDISGQSISAYLTDYFYFPSVVGSKTFPAGSEAYKLTMVPQVDIYELETNWIFPFATLNGLLSGASISTGGSVNYYDANAKLSFGALKADNTGVLEIALMGSEIKYSSTYKRVTVNNVDMIIADLASVSRHSDDKSIFFTVYNGSVHGGYYKQKNVARMDSSYNFNKTAVKGVLSAAGWPTVVQ